MSVSKQMGNGVRNRGERAGSAGCEAAGPGVGPFRARVELLAGRALPAPARVAAPPATNENVRKSMRGNKRADTRPELVVRARLRAAGLSGYRLQWKVPGHPDVAWPGKKVALFVNGCFWHRCPHCNLSLPKSNVEYWVVKFARNVERDEQSRAALEALGWKVHVVWECQLKKKTIDATMAKLLPALAEELGKELAAGSDGRPG